MEIGVLTVHTAPAAKLAVVEVNRDQGYATILPQLMEDQIVLDQQPKLNHATPNIAQVYLKYCLCIRT